MLFRSVLGDCVLLVNTAGAPRFDEEDAVTQNQLTLVTSIGPGGRARVEAVLALIDAYARRLTPPGSLAGISTIHFVRWLVFDGGRRLTMVSDYDGSWEAAAVDALGGLVVEGRLRRLALERFDEELSPVLRAAGFVPSPRGLVRYG